MVIGEVYRKVDKRAYALRSMTCFGAFLLTCA